MYSCVVVSTMFIINLLRRNKYLFILVWVGGSMNRVSHMHIDPYVIS